MNGVSLDFSFFSLCVTQYPLSGLCVPSPPALFLFFLLYNLRTNWMRLFLYLKAIQIYEFGLTLRFFFYNNGGSGGGGRERFLHPPFKSHIFKLTFMLI